MQVYPCETGRKMIRLPSLLTMSLVLGALVAPVQAQDKFTATVSFQKGVNGYENASDDSMRPGQIKLIDDRKQTLSTWHEGQIRQGKLKRAVVLEGLSNYRHVLRWNGLDKWILGNNVKVLSAKVDIFYTDEFWSFYDYEVALYRSLDGAKDGTEKRAASVAHIFGERRGPKVATPFRSLDHVRPSTGGHPGVGGRPREKQGSCVASAQEDRPARKEEHRGIRGFRFEHQRTDARAAQTHHHLRGKR